MYVECQLQIILHYFIKVTWYIKSDNCGTLKKKNKHLCVVRNEDKKNFQYNGSEGNLQTLWCIQKKPCLHFILVFCDTLIHYLKKLPISKL